MTPDEHDAMTYAELAVWEQVMAKDQGASRG